MQKCPKCLAEQNNVNSSACYYCGADMNQSAENIDDKYDNSSTLNDDEYIPEAKILLYASAIVPLVFFMHLGVVTILKRK